jgi:hypothetical protein
MAAHRDPLTKLFEPRRRDRVSQVRLPDQENLQELGFLGLEVGQQPHFLERGGAQVLRLVHHEERPSAERALLDQELPEVSNRDRLRLAGSARVRSRSSPRR